MVLFFRRQFEVSGLEAGPLLKSDIILPEVVALIAIDVASKNVHDPVLRIETRRVVVPRFTASLDLIFHLDCATLAFGVRLLANFLVRRAEVLRRPGQRLQIENEKVSIRA